MTELSRANVTLLPRIRWRQSYTTAGVCLYSVVVCAFAVVVFNRVAPQTFMGSRMDDISASIAVLDRGGPPLLRSDVPYRPGLDVSHLRPVGITDDQGIYVYLPVLAKLTGEHDPAVLMKWFFMGCFSFLVLVYPFLFYGIFRSFLVAVAAPLLLLWKFRFVQTLDLYWILAWITLLGIPSLVLAYKWWFSHRRAAGALLVSTMVAASFATSIRIHSGAALLVGALGIVGVAGVERSGLTARLRRFWTIGGWWVRPALGAAIVLGYLSIGTAGLSAVRHYRDHVIHQSGFSAAWPTQHPFWHNAYIGLGYLPNPYGIAWYDSVSADLVDRERPGSGYLTKPYEATLRHAYADIVRHDRGFVLRNYWVKARNLVADAIDRFWPAFILLPLAALVERRRRLVLVGLLVAVPAAAFSALGPILTIPYIPYELGWFGIWGALGILALGSIWATARDRFAEDLPPDLEPLRTGPNLDALRALRDRAVDSRKSWFVAAAVVLTAILGHVARPAPPPSSNDAYVVGQSPFVPSSLLDRPTPRTWNFAGSLPTGWSNVAHAFLQRDGGGIGQTGLYVRSPMVTEAPQLEGPSIVLPTGSYDVAAHALPLAGGLGIWVVRDSDSSTVASSHYWYQQPADATQAMGMSFSLTEPTRVHVVVASWSSIPNASAFILWKMKLLRTEAVAA